MCFKWMLGALSALPNSCQVEGECENALYESRCLCPLRTTWILFLLLVRREGVAEPLTNNTSQYTTNWLSLVNPKRISRFDWAIISAHTFFQWEKQKLKYQKQTLNRSIALFVLVLLWQLVSNISGLVPKDFFFLFQNSGYRTGEKDKSWRNLVDSVHFESLWDKHPQDGWSSFALDSRQQMPEKQKECRLTVSFEELFHFYSQGELFQKIVRFLYCSGFQIASDILRMLSKAR